MIKKLIICGFLALAGTAQALAASGVGSPDAAGCLDRASLMFSQENYSGCIDQVDALESLSPAPAELQEGMRLRAISSLRCGYEDALRLIDNYIESYPASPATEDMMAYAGDYWFARRVYALALDRYVTVDPARIDTPRREEVIYRTGYCALMLGNTRRALGAFGRLASVPAYRNAANFYLGYIAYEDADYTKALDYFRRTDRTTPPADEAAYYLAQICFMQGDYRQALDYARESLQRNPGDEFRAEANRIAGESLYRLGKETDAISYLDTYLKFTDNPLPSALYILGTDVFRNEDYDRAIACLRGATATDDVMGQSAWLYLGQAYVRTGNMSSALMAFEKAYQRDFDADIAETAYYNYAVAKIEGGRVPFGNSVGVLDEFLKRYPDSRYASRVQEYIVNGYLADDDYEAVLDAVGRMSRPSPSAVAARQRALFMLGMRQLASGNAQAAARRFSDARAIRASDEVSRQCDLWLGDCYYAMGKYADAVKSYRSFLSGRTAADPNYALAMYDLGYAYYAQEDYAQAMRWFNDALAVTRNPLSTKSLADATNRVGDCLYYQHKFAEAARQYRRAFDLDSSAGDYALYQLAVMEGLERNYQAKIATLDRLISLFPTSALAPAALLAKGDSYSAMDSAPQAIEIYSDVVSRYPASGYARKAQLQIAITALAASQRQQAIEAYRRVISQYPSSEEARVATDDLKRIYADDGDLTAFAAFLASVPDAPQINPSEMDALAFRAAEKEYVDRGNIERVKTYIAEYPSGTYRPQALYYMAESLAATGNTDEAYAYATDLVNRYPDADVIEDALVIKAVSESRQGKKERALATYTRLEGMASSPRNLAAARLGVMRMALVLDRYAEVLDATSKLLASSASAGNESEIRSARASALDATGANDEAAAIWRELAVNPSQSYGASAAVLLSESLLRQGNTAEARKVIDRFLDADTPHHYWQARGFIVLSDILRAQGSDFEADEYLRTLRANYPGSERDIIEMIDTRLGRQ